MGIKRLRCVDGKVRRFQTSTDHTYTEGILAGQKTGAVSDTICLECNYNFGIHSWNAIKDELKEHTC